MTELDLQNFINNNDLECEWRKEKLFLWLGGCEIREFSALISDYFDNAVECFLCRDGDIVVDLIDICSYYDIDPLDIPGENYEN